MTLLDMIRKYQDLLTEKERLSDLTKENNAAIEAAKEEIALQMLDDDCTEIGYAGYKFSLAPKTAYSKRSEAELAETGADFFGVLRGEGLGDLIVETVNSRTLQSAMANYVEENGELSEELMTVIKTYDYNDISRRKIPKKRSAAKANGGNE